MKITLNDVTNIDALSVINDNFDRIEQELQNKVLYRNNPSGEPNSISNDIDMNGNDLLNVGDVVSVNGRWATIDEVEAIKDQVEEDVATVAADKAIILGYRNTAQTAATDAQTAYDNFDDRYLGAKTSDPFVDNDGNTLLTGALYYRTSGTPIMRVYNGTTWQDVGSITTTTTNLIDPSLYSSQVEAEAGVNNTKVITPLSAKQAIDKQVKEGFTSTGPIVLPGDAVNALEAVPKQQMDLAVAVATPPGAVQAFAMSVAPTGWLKANGGAVSRTTYSALFAAIGTTFGSGDGSTTFNLPDLRGEFVRGWDDGRGVDSGRGFGTAQADEFKAHYHDIRTNSATGSGTGGGGYFISNLGVGVMEQTRSTPGGGTETRPRNVALLYCIKF